MRHDLLREPAPLQALRSRERVGPPAKVVPESRSRRIARTIGRLSIAGAVLALIALAFLATSTGRAWVTVLAERAINTRIHGTVHLGAITRLALDGVEMRDVRVDTSAGERVVSIDRMVAEVAFVESLQRGALIFAPCTLEGGEIRVTAGPRDQITLVDALTVPSDRFTVPIELRDIHVQGQRWALRLPPVPFEVTLDDVHGVLATSFSHAFRARLDRMAGFVNFPIAHVGFQRLSGRMQSDDRRPLAVTMEVDLEVAEPTLRITYDAPRVVGRDGDAAMSIALGTAPATD